MISGPEQARVLLLEQDDSLRYTRSAMLEARGISVEAVAHVSDARRLWQPNTFNVVLVAVEQYEPEVFQFCDDIRNESPEQHVVVVAPPWYYDARFSCFDAVIRPSGGPSEFVQVIERLLGIMPANTSGPGQADKQHVLVVDDEHLIADSLAQILQDAGFNAIAVYSAKSAIEAANKNCPDAIISDVVMPRVNGIELAKSVAKNCPSTKILLISGQAQTPGMVEKARDQGYQFELIPKPIRPQELIEKLRGTLA